MSDLRVVVASANPVKLRAVQQAFEQQFPDRRVNVAGVDVPSGVAEQPMSDDETRRGAQQRVRNARAAQPVADYWVGIEGGVAWLDDRLMGFAWMAILAGDGRLGEARTVTLPLPPTIAALVADGIELGEANDQVFATRDSKRKGGAYGLLTDGRYTRESVYAQALAMALIPLTHPLYCPARAVD